jgi:RNA polymerase sigma-70 factor (ECF subfamily)
MESSLYKKDDNDFKDIYIRYFAKMKRFAKGYVLLEEDAENIVHDVFTYLWENWDILSDHINMFAYLFLLTKNGCIDFLRHKLVEQKAADDFIEEHTLALRMNYHSLESFNQQQYSQEDIESMIKKALESLPEKCREIFIKNKIEGKKQKEIAEELNISINTVESQMAIAYKKLRKELKNKFPIFLFLTF